MLLASILKRYRLQPSNLPVYQATEKTMDITVRDVLTQKAKTFFKVESQLAAILCATGLAVPYVKPEPVPESARFWTAESAHTGSPGLHYRKPSGEVASTYNATATKETLEQGWGVKIPDDVWAAFEAKRKPKTGNSEVYG